ncbi:MAG: RHS repeat-associated core domain-containing protein [Anaerolineaceae bacterium]
MLNIGVHPHAVTQAGANSYGYDQNGNMTTRTVAGVVWTYTYNAENQLMTIRKNNQLVSEYGYDGDGNRVWANDYDGYLPDKPKATTYVGNHYEVRVEGYVQTTGGSGQPCSAPSYCSYFPLVTNSHTETISYYYADGQRIAMKNNGVLTYLYGDQLGSTSAVAGTNGMLISRNLYHPWGTTRYSQGTTPTDYAYTGQMQEGDIYYYGARWYDPALGRFLQPDTLVPTRVGIGPASRFLSIVWNTFPDQVKARS